VRRKRIARPGLAARVRAARRAAAGPAGAGATAAAAAAVAAAALGGDADAVDAAPHAAVVRTVAAGPEARDVALGDAGQAVRRDVAALRTERIAVARGLAAGAAGEAGSQHGREGERERAAHGG